MDRVCPGAVDRTIAAYRHVQIWPDDTPRELLAHDLAHLGLGLFAEVFAGLASGNRMAVPYDHNLATREPATAPARTVYGFRTAPKS